MISFGDFSAGPWLPQVCRWWHLKQCIFILSSRIVCTCGRIRRPLGAWMSWGITRRTTSPSDTRSPVIVRPPKPSGTIRIIHSFSSAIPAPVFALTMQTFSFVCSLSFLQIPDFLHLNEDRFYLPPESPVSFS